MDIKNIAHLDWVELLKSLESFATSLPAKDLVAGLSPFANVEEARASVGHILEMTKLIQEAPRPSMQGLDLFETWAMRLKKSAVLTPLEIKDVRLFCLETIALIEFLKARPNSISDLYLNQIMPAEEPLSAIDNLITPSGEIRTDASETLYNLFREKEQLQKQIQQILEKLVRDNQMDNYLQEKFVTSREGRWVVPVKGGSQHQVPGMIQGRSATKQTVFIEPAEVVPMNNRFKQVEWSIEQEIERLLTELSQYLSTFNLQFETTREIQLKIDILAAQATLSLRLNSKSFTFSNDSIDLFELNHPLLLLNGTDVVSNTLQLNKNRTILLLTGPNAGGKTVLLKSLGLAAQMSRCGMPICADQNSKLPFFKNMAAVIGDAQSVDAHLSTFAAHIKSLQSATEFSGPNCLLLVDEICGSTDPEEGSALARGFIETYAEKGIFACITSHLGPLKSNWKEDSKVLQGSLHYDEKTGQPTYQFIPGVAGESQALQTAKRVGVSSLILDRAYSYLTPEARARRQAFDELEKLKRDLIFTQQELKKNSEAAAKEKTKFENLLKQFETEKNSKLEKLLNETRKQVETELAAARVDDTFKRHERLQGLNQNLPEIIKVAPPSAEDVISSANDFAKKYPPGTKIFVPLLNQDGIIQGEPNSKGEVPVLSQSLRLMVQWKDLKPASQTANSTQALLRKAGKFVGQMADQERQVDLRGMKVDEALNQLERSLDLALRSGEDRLKIVHGHGTDALKRAIRAYLSRSIYVKKWKAGTPETGGDGLTWVEIGEI